uniref:Uncharacterized protein n=1 Tax=Lactuca sativa TaxID=4236 RepID=A0A9R1WL26_LACSA|nr:hypothetical protein LSAT_V11C100007560 [Lactuca sativa]
MNFKEGCWRCWHRWSRWLMVVDVGGGGGRKDWLRYWWRWLAAACGGGRVGLSSLNLRISAASEGGKGSSIWDTFCKNYPKF